MKFSATLKAVAVAAAVAVPSMAMAQPLGVTVNPLADPFSIPRNIITDPFGIPRYVVSAPFQLLAPQNPNAYQPEVARRAAVEITPDLRGVVATPVLKQTGPRFSNASAARTAPVVLRPGSVVPGYVDTAPARNVSVAGLAPNAEYAFFVSPENNVVFLEPGSRRVVRIMR